MSSLMFQYFNLSRILKLTMPLCLVSDSNMFPRLFNSFNGTKSPLSGAWFHEFVINPLEGLLTPNFQSPPNLHNLSSSFVMFDVIPKIFDVIIEIHFQSIDPKEIMDLSNSQSNLFQFELPFFRKNVVGVEKI